MNRTSHDHELVLAYLGELDAALRGVPAAQARELREQIIAHLDDALPPGADDEQVAAVLERLGRPADLAADAGRPGVAPSVAFGLTGTWLRRRVARVRGRTWAVLGVIAVLAGLGTGYVIYYVAPGPVLQTGLAYWWYGQDRSREVTTSADGLTQTTVPIRSGQRQGFVVEIENPTDVTQTILGPVTGFQAPLDFIGNYLGGQMAVSRFDPEIGDSPQNTGYTLPGVIPPHQFRLLRLLWISETCMPGGTGGYVAIDALGLRVRVGWLTRTEIVPLDQAWALGSPSQGRC